MASYEVIMARYTFSPEDRRKGGLTTSQRYNMRERGKRGLQALADKYFQGNTKKAGAALSRIGNFVIDPFPANRAWTNKRIFELPPELLAKVWGHCETDFGPLDSF